MRLSRNHIVTTVLVSLATWQTQAVSLRDGQSLWKEVYDPVEIALSSVGSTRAQLHQALESRTNSKANALPMKASPDQWVFRWYGQVADMSVMTYVNFDPSGKVSSVVIQPILGYNTDFGRFFEGRTESFLRMAPSKILGKNGTQTSVDFSKVQVLVDMKALQQGYAQVDYNISTGEDQGASWPVGVNAVFKEPVSGATVVLSTINSLWGMSRVQRTLNVQTGKYDHKITIAHGWSLFGKLVTAYASKDIATSPGMQKVTFVDKESKTIMSRPKVAANVDAAALIKADRVSRTFNVCFGNSLPMPSPSGLEQSVEAVWRGFGLPEPFECFTYTFGGGQLPAPPLRKTMEIGFVKGENGRAVVYGDFHVAWVPIKGRKGVVNKKRQ